MENLEIVSIAILWSIGLLAMIQSLNSRGPIRGSFSWILTTLIFLIALAFTYLKISNQPLPETFLNNTEQITVSGNKGPDSLHKKSSQAKERNEAYMKKAMELVQKTKIEISAIENFSPLESNATAVQQENFERAALSISTRTTAINQQTLGLFHPRAVSEIHQELLQATENLRLAGYSLHAYSTLEESGEKQAQKKQYLSQVEQAKKNLKSFQNSLQTFLE